MFRHPAKPLAAQPSAHARRHLVVDETVEFSCSVQGCRLREYRLRIWRAKHAPSIVLLSQIKEGNETDWVTVKAANLAWKCYLGFDPNGFMFWEANLGVITGVPTVSVVFLESIGPPQRHTFHRPMMSSKSIGILEEIVGETISM